MFLCIISLLISIDCVFADNGSNNDSDLDITMLHYLRLGYESSSGSDSRAGGDAVLLHSGDDYLLMDTFEGKRQPNSNTEIHPIVQYLRKKEINEISVYLSHYHSDHFGGLLSLLNSNDIRIKTLYLPKTEYFCDARDYENNKLNSGELNNSELYISPKYNTLKTTIDAVIANNNDDSKQEIEIKYLWPTNETYTTEANEYKNCFDVNNHSLIAMVSVGNTKYLTAGDISQYQENILLNSGLDLKADIMKASHHVNDNSNTINFIKSVAPKYIFAQNASAKNPDAITYDYNNNRTIKNFDEISTNENNYFNTLRYMMEGDYYNYQECTNDNCYRGANLYWEQYNGITIFSIKDDIISVKSGFGEMNDVTNFYPSDYTFLNKLADNMKKITINYVDKDTNEIISNKDFNFATNVTYHLFDSDFNKNIEGYEFVSADDIPIDGRITSDMAYNIYFKKIINKPSNSLINIPDTLSNDYFPIIMFIILIVVLGVIVYGIKKSKG